MKDETLKNHRTQTYRGTDRGEIFSFARELGFDDINMDLIMGLPEESLEDVRDTLEQVKALKAGQSYRAFPCIKEGGTP